MKNQDMIRQYPEVKSRQEACKAMTSDFASDMIYLQSLQDQYAKNLNLMTAIQGSIQENNMLIDMNKSNYRLEFKK